MPLPFEIDHDIAERQKLHRAIWIVLLKKTEAQAGRVGLALRIFQTAFL
jgi:hypothetical protein